MNPSDLAKLQAKLPLSKSTIAKNLPPTVTTDTATELGPTPSCEDQPGRACGSDSLERSAASPKRIRQSSKPLLNKLETEFRRHRLIGDGYVDQAVRFRLGNGIWYKPDFVWFGTGTTVVYEVKGPHAFRGGLENLKVAASLYPQISWRLVWKEDGLWKQQVVLP